MKLAYQLRKRGFLQALHHHLVYMGTVRYLVKGM